MHIWKGHSKEENKFSGLSSSDLETHNCITSPELTIINLALASGSKQSTLQKQLYQEVLSASSHPSLKAGSAQLSQQPACCAGTSLPLDSLLEQGQKVDPELTPGR